MTAKKVNLVSWDFDGVLSTGRFTLDKAVRNVVVTGRTIDEYPFVYNRLYELGMVLPVYFNPISLRKRGDHTLKARVYSGNHKINVLTALKKNFSTMVHYEDDPLQVAMIKQALPRLKVIFVENDDPSSL